MNFYTSREFLDAAAQAYFQGRDVSIEDVDFGGEVLRLLVVDGRPITTLLFLDVHQPLAPDEVTGPLRKGGFARQVVRRIMPLDGAAPEVGTDFLLAPFVDWSAFKHFDDYQEWLLAHHRGRIRDMGRRARGLAKQEGELVFTRDDTAPDVLPAARKWKGEQLVASGHEDFFAKPETMAFFEALRARGGLSVSTLRAGGRLASIWMGFIHDRAWTGWVFTYEPDFAKFSPGHQLLAHMLEDSYRAGHREFDFSEGAEDYKFVYATHARVLGDIGRPPLQRRLVSLAKQALHAASPELLARVRGLRRGLRQILNSKPALAER